MSRRRIILASASPRRRDLLTLAGLKFEVLVPSVDEGVMPGEEPHRYVRRLSAEKAKAVAGRLRNALVIAADTCIAFRGTIIGKPSDSSDAQRILTMLSGRVHAVITGYTIVDTANSRRLSRSVETRVWFRRLTAGEIDSYVATGEPLDKAGAYAIQGLGALLVRKIDGDYANVVGLPLGSVVHQLKGFGISIL